MESTSSCGEEVTGISTAGPEARFVPLTFFEATGGRGSLRFATLQQIAEPNQTSALNEP